MISEKVGRGPAGATLVDLGNKSVPIGNSREQRGVPCVCVLGPFHCGSLHRHCAPLCASCHSRPSLYRCLCRGAPPTVAHGRELSAPRLHQCRLSWFYPRTRSRSNVPLSSNSIHVPSKECRIAAAKHLAKFADWSVPASCAVACAMARWVALALVYCAPVDVRPLQNKEKQHKCSG